MLHLSHSYEATPMRALRAPLWNPLPTFTGTALSPLQIAAITSALADNTTLRHLDLRGLHSASLFTAMVPFPGPENSRQRLTVGCASVPRYREEGKTPFPCLGGHTFPRP